MMLTQGLAWALPEAPALSRLNMGSSKDGPLLSMRPRGPAHGPGPRQKSSPAQKNEGLTVKANMVLKRNLQEQQPATPTSYWSCPMARPSPSPIGWNHNDRVWGDSGPPASMA